MGSTGLAPNKLRVEVSGWDAEKHFFVEKSDLEWSASGRRNVRLRSHLHSGSMVFVRLLASTGLGKGYPFAHRAEIVEPSDQPGIFCVRLVESQPKRELSEAPIDPIEHLMSV